jgi:crotonobetainyl-CoA:carnitine CoA-transferase CaiB-like acyl-CoA transferase
MTATTESPAAGPLAGIRVLDFSTVISGPICSQALGDLGADVVKVEPPLGDPARYSGAPFREPGFSAFLAQFNRNKRSLALDLKHEAARAVARRLAERADVLLENFRPGVADRLGIGWAELRAINPRLVYCSICGFGSDGPDVDRPAYDHVIQAITGLMPTQGEVTAPRLIQGGVADKATGMTAHAAILAALFARERSGSGQRVEVPMLDAYAAFALPEAMFAGTFPPLTSDGPGVNDFFRTFATTDGFVVGLTIQDAQFRGLCRVLDREDMADDPRFAELGPRFQNYRELCDVLAVEIAKHPTAELIAHCRQEGAPFAAVNDLDSFLADPQVANNRTVVEVEDPRFGATRYLRHPARYETTPTTLRHHAPRLGEHSAEILDEAGFTEAEIQALRSDDVIR